MFFVFVVLGVCFCRFRFAFRFFDVAKIGLRLEMHLFLRSNDCSKRSKRYGSHFFVLVLCILSFSTLYSQTVLSLPPLGSSLSKPSRSKTVDLASPPPVVVLLSIDINSSYNTAPPSISTISIAGLKYLFISDVPFLYFIITFFPLLIYSPFVVSFTRTPPQRIASPVFHGLLSHAIDASCFVAFGHVELTGSDFLGRGHIVHQ